MVFIIFDLDETLIKYTDRDMGDLVREATSDFITLGDGTCVILRPGLTDFIARVAGMFDGVAVFTAAGELYAKEVVDAIFCGVQIVGFWTRAECVIDDRGVAKPLGTKHFTTGEAADAPGVIFVDDRPEVCDLNAYVRGSNHVVVPKFNGDPADLYLRTLGGTLAAWVEARRQGPAGKQ